MLFVDPATALFTSAVDGWVFGGCPLPVNTFLAQNACNCASVFPVTAE